MRIEVNCSGRGTTSGFACARFFVRTKLLSNFRYFALLMAAGWTTEGTRAFVSVPLPITKAPLTHSSFAQCEDEAFVEISFDILRC